MKNRAAATALLLLLVLTVSGCKGINVDKVTGVSGAEQESGGEQDTTGETASSGENGSSEANGSSEESVETEAPKPEETVSEADKGKPAGPLGEAELAEIQQLFDQTSERVCLTCYYERPEEISVDAIFYSFLSMGQDVTKEELELLQLGELFDVAKYPVKDMNSFLQDHFGITLDQVEGRDQIGMPYLAQYDAYYVNVSDTNMVVPTCISGERKADQTLEIRYTTMEEDGQWMVTLMPEDGAYRYLSNVDLSAQHNRDYLIALEQRKESLERLDGASMSYYYEKDTGELVYAVDKPAEGSDVYGVREIYFEDGNCILIQFRETEAADVWRDPREVYCEELDEYIGGTKAYYQTIGEEIKAGFAEVYQ